MCASWVCRSKRLLEIRDWENAAQLPGRLGSANPILVKMDLSVRADNDGAIALYRSFGFVEEGRHRRRMYAGGVYYDTIAMGLDVDA